MPLPNGRSVVVYTLAHPEPSDYGAPLRIYSNVRAFLDLGYAVEIVRVSDETHARELPQGISGAKLTLAPLVTPQASLLGRLGYRAGMPTASALDYYFRRHAAFLKAARSRATEDAIHLFEGEEPASAIPFLRGQNTIWSEHDIPSAQIGAVGQIAAELGNRPVNPAERRELRFARQRERALARRSNMVLAITETDCQLIRSFGAADCEYLPMSIPDEERARTLARRPSSDGRLRILHLGAVHHLPTYRSLEFLLGSVLPKVPAELRSRLAISVVGRLEANHPNCRRILELAAPFPEVSFTGFADDLYRCYENADLHLVASTQASGLRTRIIESFACGVPVLSTTVASSGVRGLEVGVNILMADNASDLAALLEKAANRKIDLDAIAQRARATYREHHSRPAVAAALENALTQMRLSAGDSSTRNS